MLKHYFINIGAQKKKKDIIHISYKHTDKTNETEKKMNHLVVNI